MRTFNFSHFPEVKLKHRMQKSLYMRTVILSDLEAFYNRSDILPLCNFFLGMTVQTSRNSN